jgi:outer membrane receptor protein involved in Fe transport
MAAAALALSLLVSTPIADSTAAPRDTTPSPRVVRRFDEIVVQAPFHDLRSSETVHLVGRSARALPVDRLRDLIALKAGVVARGENLHVRGGRAGELSVLLEGIELNEPLRHRPMEIPLVAVRSADLLTGGFDAEYGGALAGVLEVHTVDPGERFEGEAFYRIDPDRAGGRFDHTGVRLGGPLGVAGLGAVAAVEVTLDDDHLPSLRSRTESGLLGSGYGWRDDNHLRGYLKIAPARSGAPASLQVLASRRVYRPYDPMWSFDGYVGFCPDGDCSRLEYQTDPAPGFVAYRAADHKTMTDERRLAAVLALETRRPEWRVRTSLGWTGSRSITSVGGNDDFAYVNDASKPIFGDANNGTLDPFYVHWGDEPYFRKSTSGVVSARADVERITPRGNGVQLGVGVDYQEVSFWELDDPIKFAEPPYDASSGLDTLRAYRAFAPGGYGYVQGRWEFQGLTLNTGLRAQYFTAGPQAEKQVEGSAEDNSVDFFGGARGIWTFSPRAGLSYPISTRDAFSASYVRVDQPPGRDFLYENRRLPFNRHPLGDPTLEPSTVISYQMAIKHLFEAGWSLQIGYFYRDLFGQIGAIDAPREQALFRLRYDNADEGHAEGIEATAARTWGERGRLEVHYTWLHAWGTQSLEEGQYYGRLPLEDRRPGNERPFAIGEHPLDWDRRHTVSLAAQWRPRRWISLAWTTVAGSGLPWTPSERRELLDDLSSVNRNRFSWTESTSLIARWVPLSARAIAIGLEVRNVFDERGDDRSTLEGYPHPFINTLYDDYGAYRTETGRDGGAYWDQALGWVSIGDQRLAMAPRSARLSVEVGW